MVKAARGVGALSIQSAANSLLGFLFFMLFARMVSRTEMGVYATVTLIFTILAFTGTLGLDFAAARFIPHFKGKNEQDKASFAAKRILLVTLASAIIFCLSQLLASDFLSTWLLGAIEYAGFFRIAAFITASMILSTVFLAFLQGLQRFGEMALFRLVSQVLRLGVSIGLLIAGLGVAAALVGWIVFYGAIALLAFLSYLKFLSSKSFQVPVNDNCFPYKLMFRFSLPMMVYQLVNFFSGSVDSFIVLGFLGAAALGVYTVAVTASLGIILTLVMPLLFTLTPGMSEIHAKEGVERTSQALKISSRYISILFVPLCFGFAVLSPLIINIMAGVKYWDAALPLSIMCAGLATYGFSTAITSTLIALGKTVKVASSFLLASIVGLASTIFFVPFFGVVGAAFGRNVIYFSTLAFLILAGQKVIRFSWDVEALWKCCLSSMFASFVVLVFAYNTGYNLFLLPFYLLVMFIVYGLTLGSFKTLDREDLSLMLRIVPWGEKFNSILNWIAVRSPRVMKILNWLFKDS